MGKLSRHSTGLHLIRKIRIEEGFVLNARVEWLCLAKSCVGIFGKLSRVKPLLASDGEPGVWIDLNRVACVGINRLWKAGIEIGLPLLESGVYKLLVGLFLLLFFLFRRDEFG